MSVFRPYCAFIACF